MSKQRLDAAAQLLRVWRELKKNFEPHPVLKYEELHIECLPITVELIDDCDSYLEICRDSLDGAPASNAADLLADAMLLIEWAKQLYCKVAADVRTLQRREGGVIRNTDGVCGGQAHFDTTRIPVWGIESARLAGMSDERILRAYPALTPEDLAAASQYAIENAEEIRRCIAENESDID